MQEPKYNMCHDDMPQVLERLRVVTNEFGDIFTVAEVGTPDALPVMKDYTLGGSRLNTAYGFEFLGTPELTAERVDEILNGWPGEEARRRLAVLGVFESRRAARRQPLGHGRRTRSSACA